MTADVLLVDPKSVCKLARENAFAGAVLTTRGWRIPDDEIARVAVILKWPGTAETAEEMGLSCAHVGQLCKTGVLRAVKLRNKWHVDPKSIKEKKGKTHIQRAGIRYNVLRDKARLSALVSEAGMAGAAEACRCTVPTVRKFLARKIRRRVTPEMFGEALVRAYKRVGVVPDKCPPYCPGRDDCLDGECIF